MCARVNAPVYQLNLKCTCVSRSGSWNEAMGLPGAVANITLEMENLSNRGMYCIGENRPLENHSMKTQSFGNCFFPPHSKLEKKNKKHLSLWDQSWKPHSWIELDFVSSCLCSCTAAAVYSSQPEGLREDFPVLQRLCQAAILQNAWMRRLWRFYSLLFFNPCM